MHRWFVVVVSLVAFACEGGPAQGPFEPAESASRDSSEIPDSWRQARADEARARLAESDAGRLVAAAIEAHGGLDGWLSAGTLRFDFDYQPLANPARRMRTHNEVDLWSAWARQEELPASGNQPLAVLGWNGEEAWITPDADAFPSPARFWALTPYYFVGMPFVAADPGTRYERLPDAPLDGQTFQLVKLTYADGTGDSPDDYYVLYLHPETHRLHALRYVVAYPGFFPEGGHTPEKIMRYTQPTEVGGLLLPGQLDTSAWDPESGAPGEVVTRIEVSGQALGARVPPSVYDPEAGAVVTREL